MAPLPDVPPAPPTHRGDVVDLLHGEPVADPYRWLEVADDPATVAFVDAQRRRTDAVLAALPVREVLRARLTELWTYPRVGIPFARGDRWFQQRTTGRQDQPVLWTMDGPDGEGRALLDPNALSEDGTVAVSAFSVSADGGLLAYATSEAGSDWQTWHVRRVDDGTDLTDVLAWSKFSTATWLPDGRGFAYVAPERPVPGAELAGQVRGARVLLHLLGTPQAADRVVAAWPDEPDWLPHVHPTPDGRLLVIAVTRGTDPATRLSVVDPDDPELVERVVVAGFTDAADVVTASGDTLWLWTDRGADRGRVVAVDPGPDGRYGGPDTWREVVAEGPDPLLSVTHCGDVLVCHHLVDAHSVLRLRGLDGGDLGTLDLPGPATVLDPVDRQGDVRGRPGDPVVHVATTSFLEPGTVWRHHLDDGATEAVWRAEPPFDASAYVTELLHATSADGTRVPLFCTRRRDAEPDGDTPVWLYGYGGFNVPLTPAFSVPVAAWLERGGIFASAVLRGGGEFGTAWYDDGRLAAKQHVFDDFAACARHLVATGWTRPARLVVSGGSNGGLLVAATVTQHPELVGAAVCEVGVLDLLRFHRFTIGWAWTSDFGDPGDPVAFRWLRAWSPLHNVRADGRYPPVLVTTGDHDDRVVPAHSYKWTAALQAAVDGVAGIGPVLLRVETSAGHGAGKPVGKQITERADVLAFMEAVVGRD
jgi:prolyl oligopeptidase